MEMRFPERAVVVVAGVPGAGKTTLIDRAVDRRAVRVVDTEDQRRSGHAGRPTALRILVHYARILRAVVGCRPAVIHSRGTTRIARRTIVAIARLRGRPIHLLLIAADPASARAGQRARGRTVDGAEMRRHVRRTSALIARGDREIAQAEGWDGVRIVARSLAASIGSLAFEAAGEGVLAHERRVSVDIRVAERG